MRDSVRQTGDGPIDVPRRLPQEQGRRGFGPTAAGGVRGAAQLAG